MFQLYTDFGWAIFKLPPGSKIPAPGSHGCKDATKNSQQVRTWPSTCNIAVATGRYSNIFVIDIDIKLGRDGSKSLYELELKHGALPTTVVQITPTGGKHLFFAYSSPLYPDGLHIANDQSGKLGPGIDIRGEGGYVLLDPSHTKDGKYEWVTDQSPFELEIAVAPQWLLELISAENRSSQYGEKFKLPDGPISPGTQDATMFKLACSLRANNMPDNLIEESLRQALRKCPQDLTRPFTDSDIKRWLDSSAKYNLGESNTAEEANGVRIKWDLTEKNAKKKTIRNVVNFFKVDKELEGLLRFNELNQCVEFIRKPPWGDFGDLQVIDSDIIQLRVYLGTKHSFDIGQNIAFDAVINVAMNNKYHPVLNYLKSLQWDGVNRVDTWLRDYLNVEDSEYTRYVGRMLLVAACARVKTPGVKFDYLVIFEGDQGVGKSRAVQALNPQWFCEISLIDRDKDTIGKMLGHWIMEVPEMEVFRKKEVESLKAFLSTPVDKVRLPYERNTRAFPRQSLFIGTMNPDQAGYLMDITGNRRFLPVSVGNIDIQGLIASRDALFAEAWHLLHHGSPLYIQSGRIEELAVSEQRKRVVSDDMEVVVQEWLENPKCTNPVYVRGNEVWQYCFNGIADRFTPLVQRRIGRIMRSLGYLKTVKREGNKTFKCYFNKDYENSQKIKDIEWDE